MFYIRVKGREMIVVDGVVTDSEATEEQIASGRRSSWKRLAAMRKKHLTRARGRKIATGCNIQAEAQHNKIPWNGITYVRDSYGLGYFRVTSQGADVYPRLTKEEIAGGREITEAKAKAIRDRHTARIRRKELTRRAREDTRREKARLKREADTKRELEEARVENARPETARLKQVRLGLMAYARSRTYYQYIDGRKVFKVIDESTWRRWRDWDEANPELYEARFRKEARRLENQREAMRKCNARNNRADAELQLLQLNSVLIQRLGAK